MATRTIRISGAKKEDTGTRGLLQSSLGLFIPASLTIPTFGVLRAYCARRGAAKSSGILCGRAWTPELREHIRQWVDIGLKLEAFADRELKQAKRRRGRKLGSTEYPDDARILEVVKEVMARTGLAQRVVLPAVVRQLENDGKTCSCSARNPRETAAPQADHTVWTINPGRGVVFVSATTNTHTLFVLRRSQTMEAWR